MIEFVDHYPWYNAPLVALSIPPPVMPPPPPDGTLAHDDLQAQPKPTRFRIRYGVAYCLSCTFPATYCNCARQPPPDAQSPDGDGSDLGKRVLDVLRQRG